MEKYYVFPSVEKLFLRYFLNLSASKAAEEKLFAKMPVSRVIGESETEGKRKEKEEQSQWEKKVAKKPVENNEIIKSKEWAKAEGKAKILCKDQWRIFRQ